MDKLELQIEEKRKILNELMRTSYPSNYEQILLLSQELDLLIVQQTKNLMEKQKK